MLAAGASRRLRRPKQTVQLGGETLLTRAVRVASDAALAPVIVVVQAGSRFEETPRNGAVVIVENAQANEGIASSIRCGVHEAVSLGLAGVVLMTCDQVALAAEHLRALCAEPNRITGSRYAGRIGIPAYFPASSFGTLLALDGDIGARDLLRGESAVENEALALDIDTEEDVERAQRLFG